jgi:hypothetical protein
MDSSAEGPPVVGLPERFDRRLRLGPFASARDALKFLTYAAAGAVLAPFTSVAVWLGLVALGFGLTVYRPDGQPLDERAVSALLWKFRALGRSAGMKRPPARSVTGASLLGIGPGQYIAMLRTEGAPTAYLPPTELARRFESFRDLLRSVRGGLAFSVVSVAMRSGPVTPAKVDPHRSDRAAAVGYTDLVRLLCRRRSIRRVHIALANDAPGPRGISDLELRVTSLAESLGGLGLQATRLRGRSLRDAAHRWGWARVRPVR